MILKGSMTSNLKGQTREMTRFAGAMIAGVEDTFVGSVLEYHDLVRFNASRKGAIGSPRGVPGVNETGHGFDKYVSSVVSGGPRYLTGDYFESIQVVIQGTPGYVEGEVGTDAAQGRRLEFGFTGTDSMNRDYAQPPYPHFGPAWNAVIPEIPHEIALTAAVILLEVAL